MTIEDFNTRITKGEKLVILDDLVLNVAKFMSNHPGGAFLISQNIGRDVAKFFYGGYILDNYKGSKPYTHSNIARKTVNSLIVGRLEQKATNF